MHKQEEINPVQEKALRQMEQEFQQSLFNKIIYQNKEVILALFLDDRMKRLVCQFIEGEMQVAINRLCTRLSIDETNFARGYIMGLRELLEMSQRIKNRQEFERNYKQFLSDIDTKELN